MHDMFNHNSLSHSFHSSHSSHSAFSHGLDIHRFSHRHNGSMAPHQAMRHDFSGHDQGLRSHHGFGAVAPMSHLHGMGVVTAPAPWHGVLFRSLRLLSRLFN